MRDIYLDNNATTKPLPEVQLAVGRALENCFGNPSSLHAIGLLARKEVERARSKIADFVHAQSPTEIGFTSGATAAVSQIFDSCLFDQRVTRIVIGATEHAATIRAAEKCANGGKELIRIPVSRSGQLDLDFLRSAVVDHTCLVSIALVNNETGVISDAETVGGICQRAGAVLHIDAAQAAGRVDIDVRRYLCGYLSLSPHKFHGPKGIGLLYGSHSQGCQTRQPAESASGTSNVPGIIGTAAAIDALADWASQISRIGKLRDRLEHAIVSAIPGCEVNGASGKRVGNTTNIYFPHRNAADMVEAMSQRSVYASAGAACSDGQAPSHVIQAMGYGPGRANASVRFSLSRFTSAEDIDVAVPLIVDAYRSILPAQESDLLPRADAPDLILRVAAKEVG